MDASYWGRSFGVMVFRDLYRKQNLFWKYVKNETVADYLNGIELLKQKGWNIVGVVCDGKSGLLNAIETIPVQLCQYHQYKTVIRYITKKPKLQAGIELKSIADLMQKTDKESFVGAITEWYLKWEPFLHEKTYTSDKKRNWRYTHNRIRSAYNSLNRYQNHLFTWYDYPELRIPATNNSIEGTFSNIKSKVANHNGLKRSRKVKLINHLLQK
jgi:transposase-like protein